MNDWLHQRADGSSSATDIDARIAPGRRTLTMAMPARGEPVQQRAAGEAVQRREASQVDDGYQRALLDAALRPDLHDLPVQRAGGGAPDGDHVHEAAAAGISGASGPLPHLDAIQRAFGRHSVAHVEAHTDGAAETGARAMGAEAFATGHHVAFAGAPSLHTAAHEAAHVVQQAAGVHLAGGVGAAGDAYERHADEVADRTVRGESAEALLDEMAGAGAGVAARAVQRVEWDGWQNNMGNVTPGTASLARVGMAIVEMLADRGLTARIGGSLSASFFGGQRPPRDIDVDVAGPLEAVSSAQAIFHSLINRVGAILSIGRDMFFLTGWNKTSEGYTITFNHVVTARALDPLDDDDAEEITAARTAPGTAGTAKVDFSSEQAFAVSGINADSKPGAPGFYGPGFLIASYLNRLSGNINDGAPDGKGDRNQVTAMLVHHIRSIPEDTRPTSPGAIRHLLGTLKHQILGTFLADTNPRGGQIDALFDGIISAVVLQLAPPSAEQVEQALLPIASLPMHEDESPPVPVPPELVLAVSQLALPLLNLGGGDT